MKNLYLMIFISLIICYSCQTRVEKIKSNQNGMYGYFIKINYDNELEDLINDVIERIGSLTSELEENVSININLHSISDCSECYYYKTNQNRTTFDVDVYGGYPLGIQYGLYSIFESIGYRFLTPYNHFIPRVIELSNLIENLKKDESKMVSPFLGIRGLHLHTLHPIEALYDVWLGSDTDNAFRIIDWLIKIRGNYVQWVALKDILDKDRYDEWKDKTASIITYAHKRGVKVGINCLVFAASSLQNGYVIEKEEDLRLIKDLDFDIVNLSFGEFVGTEPTKFISEVNSIVDKIKSAKSSIKISGTIHVGNFDNLWIDYNNEMILYYFLIKYVKEVIPFVHTVMYFNLIEPSVGAYNHKTFKEHREFLLEYLNNNKKVIYFPESAYWIAFDNSIPLYLPVYMRSRYLDIELMNSECKSDICKENAGHIIFTSGWEWGYHQTDYLSTRLSYNFDKDFRSEIIEIFKPMGEYGKIIGEMVYELAELQSEYLIYKKLAAYYAGVDAWVELGHKSGIIGQPDRIMVDEVPSLNSDRRETFRKNVLENMRLFADKMNELYLKIKNFKESEKIGFVDEVIDGFEVDFFRSLFVYNVYSAVFYGDMSYLNQAEEIMKNVAEIIKGRHSKLYYKQSDKILYSNENPTIYKFGYLKQADQLCLYKRDFIKAKNILNNYNEEVPSCIE